MTTSPDPSAGAPADLLARLERYYDGVPRGRARAEEVGPFTLFVATSGWPYYARPRLGVSGPFSADDVHDVLARQRELGVPQAIEWVDDTTPALYDAVVAAGVPVERCPLLVLAGRPSGDSGTARVLDVAVDADVADVAASRAAVSVGFANSGTAVGEAGVAEREAALTSKYAVVADTLLDSMRAGRLVQAAVYDEGDAAVGPVGGGSFSPLGGVAEIAGVAVLPAYRRRGLAGQLTLALASHALAHGVTTVFCSAQSDAVARVYEAVGFRRVATACIAELPDS
ncbi:MAG: GNAT family N-acetyltransferase [Nocardioidaceae bacterium]